jgi:hypothetical protein
VGAGGRVVGIVELWGRKIIWELFFRAGMQVIGARDVYVYLLDTFCFVLLVIPIPVLGFFYADFWTSVFVVIVGVVFHLNLCLFLNPGLS